MILYMCIVMMMRVRELRGYLQDKTRGANWAAKSRQKYLGWEKKRLELFATKMPKLGHLTQRLPDIKAPIKRIQNQGVQTID